MTPIMNTVNLAMKLVSVNQCLFLVTYTTNNWNSRSNKDFGQFRRIRDIMNVTSETFNLTLGLFDRTQGYMIRYVITDSTHDTATKHLLMRSGQDHLVPHQTTLTLNLIIRNLSNAWWKGRSVQTDNLSANGIKFKVAIPINRDRILEKDNLLKAIEKNNSRLR